MDSHHRGFRAIECHLAGVCRMALAVGVLGGRQGGCLRPGEQHRADAGDAEVLDHHPPARGGGRGDPETYRRTDRRRGHPGLSAAEGVCLQSAHRLADMGDRHGVLRRPALQTAGGTVVPEALP